MKVIVSAVVLGVVLVGGPAWAQEDPCAPGPDGSVPDMCQSGPPASDTGTVGMRPGQPCPAQPVEPGDGVICAFAVPASNGTATPESAAGGGTAGGQLPRTGPYDRLLALIALGSGLVVLGAGAAATGRRHRSA